MRSLILFLCLSCIVAGCDAQHKEPPPVRQKAASVYPVAFYNVENLFDTEDDPETDDDEFTPNGPMRYTNEIYRKKLHNIATVLQVLGDKKNKEGIALLGMAEVENDRVLNDLLSQPEIKDRGYRYVWYDSNDPRGIDVALVYNPAYFTVISSKPLHVGLEHMGGKEGTRDVLYVIGRIGNDTVHVFVNHWPSRREGLAETMEKRAVAAETNRRQIDHILSVQPNARIIVMGDMNDNPMNESITQVLGATEDKNGKLYDPWGAFLRSGKGTEIFQHHWNLFDQVIVSAGLLHNGLHYEGADIEDRDFMKLQYGKLQGYPKRSFRGTYWSNGYSDHFPVVIYLVK
ncbi:MAG: endonuclease/exonuclease/phosphatase [Bacteroidetes bacterium]|nr:endonuclease/exonuclease/phosphatase [Bacteroidota bacterium]